MNQYNTKNKWGQFRTITEGKTVTKAVNLGLIIQLSHSDTH